MMSIWISLFLLAAAILIQRFTLREGFLVPISDRRCGLGMPPCSFGSACINGYCAKAEPPGLPKSTGLPVIP